VKCTCIAMYAREAVVMRVIPYSQALSDLVALTSFSTKLGEVKMCLNACPLRFNLCISCEEMDTAHPNEKLASEEATPRIFGIIFFLIDKHWPLIAMDSHLATDELRLHTNLTW